MIQSYKHNGHVIFNLDTNSDHSQSFEFCANYLKENFRIKTIEYWPVFWNSGKLKFLLDDIDIELIYMDFGGTELRISEKNELDKILQVTKIAETLLKELRKLKLVD